MTCANGKIGIGQSDRWPRPKKEREKRKEEAVYILQFFDR